MRFRSWRSEGVGHKQTGGGSWVDLVGEATLAWLSPTAGKKGRVEQGWTVWKKDRAFVWDSS